MTKECFQTYKVIKNHAGLFDLNIENIGSYDTIELETHLEKLYEIIDLRIDSFYKDKDISILDVNSEIEVGFPLFSDEEIKDLWIGDEKYLSVVQDKLRKMIYSYISEKIKRHNDKLYDNGLTVLNPL